MDRSSAITFVGIDVSKDSLDACLIPPELHRHQSRFSNNPKGHAALLLRAERLSLGSSLHFCMEATGPFSDALACFLAQNDRLVSIVNPIRIKHARLAWGRSGKTDRADAALIADFAAREQPAPWVPAPPEVRELQALMRRIDDLTDLAAREKIRLASPALNHSVRRSIQRTLRWLRKEAASVRAAADQFIDATVKLAVDWALLESIPGVGRQTANTILAELPSVEKLPGAESAAAYCGLSPREFQSGTSVKKRTRLSKCGNSRLRKALFLPTQTAVRFNPILRCFYERLIRAGKPKMQAIGACMRKLSGSVMVC
jgi:transposase